MTVQRNANQLDEVGMRESTMGYKTRIIDEYCKRRYVTHRAIVTDWAGLGAMENKQIFECQNKIIKDYSKESTHTHTPVLFNKL